jgi:adenylosuccinate lyase
MLQNIESSGGLMFSQKLLLALVEHGVSREDAYGIVQRNAMKVWENGGKLQENVASDSEIIKYLTGKEIKNIFDIKSFIINIGHIFKRIGLPNSD